MSGCGYDAPCPNCQGSMDCYSDHKPHDYVSGECIECGFEYWTKAQFLSLEDLNGRREDKNHENEYVEGDGDFLPPLKELPERNPYI